MKNTANIIVNLVIYACYYYAYGGERRIKKNNLIIIRSLILYYCLITNAGLLNAYKMVIKQPLKATAVSNNPHESEASRGGGELNTKKKQPAFS